VQIPEMKTGMGPQKAKHFLSSMATVAGSGMENMSLSLSIA
jgi:hypothetical protein